MRANATATGSGAMPMIPSLVSLSSGLFTASTVSPATSTTSRAVLAQPFTEVPIRVTPARSKGFLNSSWSTCFKLPELATMIHDLLFQALELFFVFLEPGRCFLIIC